MRAIFKQTRGEYLEAILEIDGITFCVMDDFGGQGCIRGELIDIELSAALHSDDEEWNSMFSGNPEGKKTLEHKKGWCYRAYGIITSIEPEVMVDVGITRFEAPINTHDSKVIGQSIAFTIARLDAQAS